MNSALNAEDLARLRALGAATIYEAQGQRGSISATLGPLDPMMTVAGTALTVDCGPGDNLMLHAALAHAQPGDVLVADAKGFRDAGPWGDVLTAAAQKVGLAGLVINGCVRDAAEIVRMEFPVFCLGLSIRGTTKSYKGSIGSPVTIVDTVVRAGDIIVGDRDGLVVIAQEEVAHSLQLADAREVKEREFRKLIEEGASTVDLLGLRETLNAYSQ